MLSNIMNYRTKDGVKKLEKEANRNILSTGIPFLGMLIVHFP